jgi:hypothetical protein
MLAQLLACGQVTDVEASYLTGYTPQRIYQLRQDPAFAELLAGYAASKELAFVDVLARMRSLGISAMEEIQARLEEAPEEFSLTKLQELMDMLLVKGRSTPGGAVAQQGSGGSAPAVQISFVTPGGPVIQGEVGR